MVIIKEGLTGKNPAAKVSYGTLISNGFTDNANFADVGDHLTTLNSATGALNLANGTKNTANIALMTTAFDNAIKAIVLYAQGKLVGVPDDVAIVKVDSTNLKYIKRGKPVIADLAAKAGVEPLTVDLRKLVTTGRKHVAYVWQRCEDPAIEAGYTTCCISTVASVTVSGGMKPQTKYWFRVATVEGQVMTAFSDPISFTTA